MNNDFTPTTQAAIQAVAITLLGIVFAAVALIWTGVVPPAPWSPLGQAAHAVAPLTSSIFNPDATLDTSRVHDRNK